MKEIKDILDIDKFLDGTGNKPKDRMKELEEFDKQKTKVLKYIMYKKRSEYEVRNKFKSIIPEQNLERIIEYFIEAGYINDEEYIERIIKEYMNLKRLSLKELMYKLYAKGLKKELIEDYIEKHEEEMTEYERKSARELVEKKKSQLEKEEIINNLRKKGYRSENITIGEE